MLGFGILEGVLYAIILTKVLRDSNVGFYLKTPKRVFMGSTAIIGRYTLVCVEEEFEDMISGLSCVNNFVNNDLMRFIHNAFKAKLGLSLELNKIPFYA